MTRGCSAGLRLQSPSSDSWVTSASTSFLYSRHAGASASRSKSGGPRGRPEGHAMLLGLRLLWLRPYPARPVQGLRTHCSASTLRSRLPSQSPSPVSASAPLSSSRPLWKAAPSILSASAALAPRTAPSSSARIGI